MELGFEQQPSLLEQTPSGLDESTLSFPKEQPQVQPMPPNAEEVAGQLAAANAVPDYKAGVLDYLNKIQTYGQAPLHMEVWEKRRQADIDSARSLAQDYAAQGNVEGVNSTLTAINEKYKGITSPTPVQAQTESAREAVENISYPSADRHVSSEAYLNAVDGAADRMAAANILNQNLTDTIKELDTRITTVGKITDFFGMLAPGNDYISTTHLANRITGSNTINEHTALAQLANKFMGMSDGEQKLALKQIVEMNAGLYGITTDLPATKRLLEKFQNYTSKDFLTDAAFLGVDAFVVSDLVKGARAVVRIGKNIRSIADTAGKESAGKVLASDMTKGTNLSGLSDQERIDSALAAGKIPMEADPARVAGMSSEAQEALTSAQRDLYASTAERLKSSGLAPEEISKALAELRAQYDPARSKSISSVVFGEGDELGQKMTVTWQGPDGRSFLTKEAAEAYAKSKGMVNYTILEKAEPSIPKVSPMMDSHEKTFFKDATAEFKDDLEKEWAYADEARDVEAADKAQAMLAKVGQAEKLLAKGKLTAKEEDQLNKLIDEFQDYSINKEQALSGDDLAGAPIFQGKDRFHFTEGITDDVKGLVTDLTNIFGLKRNVVVSTFDDFANLAKRDPFLTSLLGQVEQAKRVGGGAHTTALVGGEESHIILLGKNMTKKDLLTTTVHEFGHAFDREFLKSSKNAPLRKALEADFNSWLNKKSLSEGQEFKDFLAHRLDMAGRKEIAEDVGRGTVKNFDDFTDAYGTAFTKWTAMFDEYWADQFAKFALTDAKPVTAVEKYFAQAADAIKRAYAYVADKLGIKFDASKPDKAIREFLEEHNKKVASGETIPLAPWALQYDFHLAAKTGTKPRIKLKVPKNTEAAKDPVGYLIQEQRHDPLAYTKEGFSKEDIASMPWIAVDPKHGASELLVAERVIGVHAEAKLKKTMSDYIKPFYDVLSNKERERVGAILTEGDAYSDVSGSVGKEFNYMELRERGLNEKEAQAYFAYRGLRQYTWSQRNAEQVRHLTALGYKELGVTLVSKEGAGSVKKLVAKEVSGDITKGKVVFDARRGSTIRITDKVLEELKADGSYVAELFQPEKLNGKFHKYVIGHPDHTTAKGITTAVPYRPGEFSRIYTDEYFVTAKRGAEIDGEGSHWVDTLRTAKSEREAKEFVAAMNGGIKLMNLYRQGTVKIKDIDAALEKLLGKFMDPREFKAEAVAGEFDDIANLDFHYTRNKEEYLNGSINEAISSGRTFVSKRGERLYSVDKRRENTLDVYKSIQAEMANVSRVMSISQWRENAIRRWMNSFGDKIPNRTGNDVADFFRANNAVFSKRDQQSLFAERTHSYILRQIGVKTNEEIKYDAFTRALTERYFKDNEAMESIGAAVRQKSFLGFMRNINFNLTLGMWNPAQLLVQANGAATAIAISPLHGLAAVKTFPLLRMALMSDNPAVWKQLAGLQKLSDMGLSSAADFSKLVVGIRKAGILDNLRSTALFNLEEGSTNMLSSTAGRVWGTQAGFFNRGEEFSRVVSFDVARREWQKLNPELDWASDTGLKEIVKRMDDLTQNMTKANLAGFQTGIVSIPFQFLQYNIKLAANVVTSLVQGKGARGFTRFEAARLLAGHLVLYGAAGNGVSWVVDEMLSPSTKNSLTIEEKTYLGQGLLAGLINSISEATTGKPTQIAVGSRLGTFDYYQQLANAVFKDPANIYDALLGPTAATAQRLGVVADVAALWHKDPDLTSRDILEGLTKIGVNQIASLRNATKAYIYATNEGKMSDKRGNAIGTVNESEILAAAVGFQPTVAIDTYNLYQSKKDHDGVIKDLADLISSTQKDIIFELQKGTEDGRARAQEKKKTLQALWPNNAGDAFEVERLIKDKIYPYDSQFQKLLGEYLWHGYNYEQPLVITKEPTNGK